jgi:hypothetical protein
MTSLYALTQEFAELSQLVDEDAGDVTDWSEEMIARLDALPLAIEQKAEGCCRLLKMFEGEAHVFREEEKRLAARRRARENAAARLKQYVHACMNAANVQEIKTDLFSLRVQRNGHSVQDPIDFAQLPTEFQIIEVKADKRKIINTHKETGQEIPGAVIVQTESLRIR